VKLTQTGNQVIGSDGGSRTIDGTAAGNQLTGRWGYGSDVGQIDATMDCSCTKFTGTYSGDIYNGASGELGKVGFTGTRIGAVPRPTAGGFSRGGSCNQWNAAGIWHVQQNNGYTPTFRLQQSGQTTTGTLTHSDSDRDRGGLSVGTYNVSGSASGAKLDVMVTGPNSRNGTPIKPEYTATVSSCALSNDTITDLTSGTSYSWSASGAGGSRVC
jgi:hypothetical protein